MKKSITPFLDSLIVKFAWYEIDKTNLLYELSLAHRAGAGPLFSTRFTCENAKKKWKNKTKFLEKTIYVNMTKYHFMDPILGNKGRVGSIEVPFDRAHPEKQHIHFPNITIHFNWCGWLLKWNKAKNKHQRNQIGTIWCDLRPQFIF